MSASALKQSQSHSYCILKNGIPIHEWDCLAKWGVPISDPGETKYFQEVFNEATTEKYGFLIVDLKQRSNNLLRYRTINFKTVMCLFT